jgi:predicted phage tail protein
MITVKYIPNILSPEGRKEFTLDYNRGYVVKDYIKQAGLETEHMRVIVSGAKLTKLDIPVDNFDEVIVTPELKGPVIQAVIAFWGVYGAVISLAAAVISLGYAIYQAVSFKKPAVPNFGSTGDGMDESSPTYGWNGIHTLQDVGCPIPIVYGEHKVGGNIINTFIRNDGNKNYLNILLGLCEGEIEDITEIKINDNPIANFDGITTYERLGTNAQTVIPNFHDLHDLHAQSQLLTKDNAYVYTTVLTNVEAFELYFTFPYGLYTQNATSGGLSTAEATYQVEYKLHSDGSYTDLGSTTVSDKSRTAVRRVYRKDGLTAGQYDIRITKTSDDSTTFVITDLQLTNVDEIRTDDIRYPNTAILGIEAMATEQLSSSMPNISCIVLGRKVSVPQVIYDGSDVDWEDYYWDSVALEFKRFVDDASCTWDGTSFVDKYSANPVWCIQDLLTNTRYGLGDFIVAANIDTTLLLEMAKYCEERVPDGSGGYEKRFRMDVVIDSASKVPDLLSQLAGIFRAMVFYSAGTIKFRIDKPETATQLFGMGNIIKDGFSQSWKSMNDTPNVIEVQFLDKDKDYANEQIAVIDEAALAAGDPIRKKQIRIFTTNVSYALREGRYALKVNKYIDRSIGIKVGIDAIACQVGDRIEISHDVPQWGFSGRLESGSTDTHIMLDRDMTLEVAKTYHISVRLSDDTIEEKTITTPAGTVDEIDVSVAFSEAPAAYCVYSIGEVDKVTKPFRVINMRLNHNNEIELVAIEYNEGIYDDSAIVIPDNNYSALDLSTPDVTNLTLTERLVKLGDGTIEDCIDVWFVKPSQVNFVKMYARARIYLSEDDGVSWQFKGETTGESFQIIGGLVDGEAYRIAVCSVSDFGQENAIAVSPIAYLTLVGKSAPPSDVTTFLVNQSRDRLYFGWGSITDVDLAGYEIRYGASWGAGSVIATGISQTSLIILDFRTGADQSFWIKAIDTTGNYSLNAKEAVITIDNIPFTNIIESYSEQTGWAGTKSDLSKVGDNLEIDAGHLSGTYETPARNLGYGATFKIGIDSVVVDGSADRRFDDDETSRFNDNETSRWSGEEVTGAVSFEIKTSEDNVTWTAYGAWQAGDYTCKYFQIKMTLTRSDEGKVIQCSALDYYADLPDVDEFGDDAVADAGTGKTVTFTKTFHIEPVVNINVTSGDGIYYKTTSKDTTSMVVKLYKADGTSVTGDFEFHLHGV